MHYVYLIESKQTPTHRYVGLTADLKQRLEDHNSGKSAHTSKFGPWRLVTYVAFSDRIKAMAIGGPITAPRSPWRDLFVKRAIDSIRRGILHHVIVLNARHLCRILTSCADHYRRSRTHLAPDKNALDGQPMQAPAAGKVVAFPRYERLAA